MRLCANLQSMAHCAGRCTVPHLRDVRLMPAAVIALACALLSAVVTRRGAVPGQLSRNVSGSMSDELTS